MPILYIYIGIARADSDTQARVTKGERINVFEFKVWFAKSIQFGKIIQQVIYKCFLCSFPLTIKNTSNYNLFCNKQFNHGQDPR